ncbi:MAG: AEC family transporter [Clostridiales bacterium]|nr:AEC family transporter [Clostridiales bacterium]
MEVNTIISQVAVLFFIMIFGFFARKNNIISEGMTEKLSDIILQLTQPLLVITSFNFDFSKEMLRNAGLIFLLSLGIHLFSIGVSLLMYSRYPHRTRSVLRYVTVFSNCGYMGFPVLQSIFGNIGIFYGSMYVVPFSILTLSYGIMVFTGKSDKEAIKKILTHPIIISVGVGMILFLLQLKLPAPLYNAAYMVGSMTSPLSMLIVGALLANMPLKEMFKGFPVYFGSIMRLIVMPALVFMVLKLFTLPEDIMRMSVILTAMPAAVNTAIFAEKYGGNAEMASRAVGISTILSVVTIPLFMLMLR